MIFDIRDYRGSVFFVFGWGRGAFSNPVFGRWLVWRAKEGFVGALGQPPFLR